MKWKTGEPPEDIKLLIQTKSPAVAGLFTDIGCYWGNGEIMLDRDEMTEKLSTVVRWIELSEILKAIE